MNKLQKLIKEIIQEQKRDRCLRIADRKYDKPSAYKSGAVVKCRKGMIWKGLKEGKQVGTLYHFTPFEGIKGILKSNTLKVGDDSNFETGGNVGKVSLTRDKNLNYFNYRITLDGNKLSNNYKINPYSYDIRAGESEESVNRDIKNIDKYIIDIHYMLGDIDTISNLTNLNKIIKLYPNIKFIYKNKEVNYEFVKDFIKEFPQEINSSEFSKTYEYKGKEWILTQSKNKMKEWPYYYEYAIKVDGKEYNIGRSESLINDFVKVKPGYTTIKDIFNNILEKRIIKEEISKLSSENKFNTSWKDLKETIHKIIQEDESLRKWFKRKGAPGKKGGWVDCNTCREVDGKTKCKACGREKGEKRSKYPSCRPTAAKCKDPGKGTKWGKTK